MIWCIALAISISEVEQMRNDKAWPRMVPPYLRRLLADVLKTGWEPLAADVWTNVREWLIKHRVEPPQNLPEDKPPAAPGSDGHS